VMLFAKIRSLIKGLFRRQQLENDMSDEIQFHIEARANDLMARQTDRDGARRRARLEFGSFEKYREEARRARGLRLIDELRGDLLYGWRSLRRSRVFTLVAATSLALGIGANTLIFSLLNVTLLSSLGYPEPDKLAVLWTVDSRNPGQIVTSSVSTYFALRDRNRSFEALGAFNGGACGIRSLGADENGASAERLYGQCFSPSLFGILGLKPLIGRTFIDAEDQIGNVAPVVLISHGLWQRRFGADPQIVGKTVTLNQVATTVIGVLPADFHLFRDPNVPLAARGPEIEFIAPLELGPTQVNSRIGGNTLVGRLKPGVSIEQAQAEIDSITTQLGEADPVKHGGLGGRAEPLLRVAHRDYRSSLLLLQGAVSFVLLIGCANVAGLLLARNAVRRNEVALRVALGAGRWRITRQLITESIPLAVLGGAIGMFLSTAGLSLFATLAPADFPQVDGSSLNLTVLGFTALVVLLASAFSSVLPAMQAVGLKLIDPLKESGRSATGGIHRHRVRKVLVMGQIALALVLLIGAGLMINSFVRVVKTDFGADPTNLLTFAFQLPPAETIKPTGMYRGIGLSVVNPKPALLVERLLENLKGIPGVLSVAATNAAPFAGIVFPMPFLIEGQTPQLAGGATALGIAQSPQTAGYFAVTPGFFNVMKIPIVQGRDFDSHDTANGRLVLIVNETMARQFFPNENAIGKQLKFDAVPDERPREIIGVVADTLSGPLQRQQAPAIYLPHLQQASQWPAPWWGLRSGMYFLLRTGAEPSTVMAAVKSAVGEVDRNIPAADLTTVEQILDKQTRTLRLYAVLLGMFAMVAAVLAGTGIYGVIAYSVAERTREIGIRMALGSRRADVVIMVLRQAAWIIGGGVMLGLASAVALTRFIQSSLFGITATDITTYVVISLLLVLIAAVACLIPARRAAGVDPVTALRHD
jgi:predicted permease